MFQMRYYYYYYYYYYYFRDLLKLLKSDIAKLEIAYIEECLYSI